MAAPAGESDPNAQPNSLKSLNLRFREPVGALLGWSSTFYFLFIYLFCAPRNIVFQTIFENRSRDPRDDRCLVIRRLAGAFTCHTR